MAGFDTCIHNHFQQFCENFTNEKLQNAFQNSIISKEIHAYKSQGVVWKVNPKKFFESNDGICDLFDAPKEGIISIIKEELLLPSGNDGTFANKVHLKFHKSKIIAKGQFLFFFFLFSRGTCHFGLYIGKDRRGKGEDYMKMVISHHAGKVTYEIEGFFERNIDALNTGARETMHKSTKNKLMKTLFDPKKEEERLEKLKKAVYCEKSDPYGCVPLFLLPYIKKNGWSLKYTG